MPDIKQVDHQQKLSDRIGRKEQRKLKARNERYTGLWYGFGMFGVIGWSVMVPTLAGLAVGIWIDHTWKSRFSWTLMMLMAGVFLGCLNAWFWVKRERDTIEKEREL